MKYVYVVTRIMPNNQEGIVNIPNLGVHTSGEKALMHYRNVVRDRMGHDLPPSRAYEFGQIFATNSSVGTDRYLVIAEKQIGSETLRLEKWKVG